MTNTGFLGRRRGHQRLDTHRSRMKSGSSSAPGLHFAGIFSAMCFCWLSACLRRRRAALFTTPRGGGSQTTATTTLKNTNTLTSFLQRITHHLLSTLLPEGRGPLGNPPTFCTLSVIEHSYLRDFEIPSAKPWWAAAQPGERDMVTQGAMCIFAAGLQHRSSPGFFSSDFGNGNTSSRAWTTCVWGALERCWATSRTQLPRFLVLVERAASCSTLYLVQQKALVPKFC